ncbi:MAG: nucleotidyltransferase domain-containing protein [bacterium]|jgi:predicted nucleotidyltransferase
MISRNDITNYVAALAGQFAPERVILFGSYARGNPHEDSDVDMLVIMNHDKRKDVEQAVAIDIQLQRKFPLDLIVRRPSEIKKRLSMGDMFLSTILKEGVILHERHP